MKSFIKKVALRNYKSIARCNVNLPPLCFIVGKNGAGKSNFIDALRLVSDALNTSLDLALRDRSGINEVRRRSSGHPTHFSIRLDFTLLNGDCGYYEFRVGSQERGGFEVQQEECRIGSVSSLQDIYYRVESGQVRSSSIDKPPAAKNDRLYLVNLSGFDEFRPLYDSLSRMGFYNLNPDVIKNEQPPDSGLVLKRDGSNLASVLERIKRNAPEAMDKIEDFLSKVVPGVKGVSSRNVLSKETIEFRQSTKGSADPWRFLAANMSDGTLRTLGILVALFQGASMYDNPTPLIGIEEPESALHPGAAAVLRDALIFTSRRTQVLVTSHSPDLLDDKQITADSILAVSSEDGVTTVAPIDEASRSAIHDGLYTAGELLRINQLEPANTQVSENQTIQPDLFVE